MAAVAYDVMRMTYEMQKAPPATVFRG